MTAVTPGGDTAGGVGELVVDERFAIVPEWLLDADISDAALRLYAVLLRYGQSSGARMPGRATLARRLRKKSVDSVDRAMRELTAVGAVTVEHRYAGGQRLTNRYHLKAVRAPGSRTDAATPDADGRVTSSALEGRDSRTDAATSTSATATTRVAGVESGRTDAAGVAADLRPNPQQFTQTTTTSPTPAEPPNAWQEEEAKFLDQLGIADLDAFAARVQTLRQQVGAPVDGAHLKVPRPAH